MRDSWKRLDNDIVTCERCPRLRAHCHEVARVKRRAYLEQSYWGRPVPGFGDHKARMLIVGLAPAAHGANRTGRMFTGDRSGEWLYSALFRAGLANRAVSENHRDGLKLSGAFITATCRCAPPGNRPTPDEQASCASFMDREIEMLRDLRVVVALGGIAWGTVLRRARRVAPGTVSRPRPVFGHGAETLVGLRPQGPSIPLLGCYHPSQQNTQTGRLTRPMLDRVMKRAARIGGTVQ